MSAEGSDVSDLSGLLSVLEDAARDQDRVSVEAIMRAVGRRSFGPLLLAAGLVGISPVGDIPGGPSIIGVMVLIVAVQLLAGRDGFWLPTWLRRRSVAADKFRKGIGWLQRPAGFVDRLLRPRLTSLTRARGTFAVAVVAAVVGIAMVPMEFVPFSATGAALTLIALGLSLVAHDGLLALLAFVVFGGTLTLVVWQLV